LDTKRTWQIQNHSSRDNSLKLIAKYKLFDHKRELDILKEIKAQSVKETAKINGYKMSVERRILDYCRLLYNVSRREKRIHKAHRGDSWIVILRSERGTGSKSLKAW